MAATLVLGLATPVAAYVVLRRVGRFSVSDAAGIAAHYGSVSVVTFTAASAAAVAAGLEAEAFLPALVAVLEVPGIAVALYLARSEAGGNLRSALRDIVGGPTVLLLGGGLVIGSIASPASVTAVEPLFVALFPGLLTLFLLDLGAVTGQRFDEVRKAGRFLVVFALVTPVVFGAAGLAAGFAAGLSPGGAAVLATMAASASYIAAPAAVSIGLPGANPALGLSAALGVTFPFNLVVGIPLALWAAAALA